MLTTSIVPENLKYDLEKSLKQNERLNINPNITPRQQCQKLDAGFTDHVLIFIVSRYTYGLP